MNYEEELENLDKLFGTKELESNTAFSYSRFSDFDDKGPHVLIEKRIKKTNALMIGNLVDDMINPDVDINKIYFRTDIVKPSATLGKLTNIILDNFSKMPSKQKVLEIVKRNNYWSNIVNEDTLIKQFDKNDFWEYLKIMYQVKKKTIVTTDQYLYAEDLANIVKQHEFTKYLFTTPHIQIFYQVKFNINYKGLYLRGIVDFVVVDHKERTVTIMDLKTGKEDALDFMKSFINYRYYLQEAIYMQAVGAIMKKLRISKRKYKVKPFTFLYVSKSQKVPMFHVVSEKWSEAALKGFETRFGTKFRGLDQITEDVKWHLHNKIFDMTRAVYETQGHHILKDNFINVMNEKD